MHAHPSSLIPLHSSVFYPPFCFPLSLFFCLLYILPLSLSIFAKHTQAQKNNTQAGRSRTAQRKRNNAEKAACVVVTPIDGAESWGLSSATNTGVAGLASLSVSGCAPVSPPTKRARATPSLRNRGRGRPRVKPGSQSPPSSPPPPSKKKRPTSPICLLDDSDEPIASKHTHATHIQFFSFCLFRLFVSFVCFLVYPFVAVVFCLYILLCLSRLFVRLSSSCVIFFVVFVCLFCFVCFVCFVCYFLFFFCFSCFSCWFVLFFGLFCLFGLFSCLFMLCA